MTNEELWRLVDDAIIPAPEAMIMLPMPVALPPEVEVGLGEVAAEVELGEVAAEAVVDKMMADRAVEEVETEEVAAEEVVTDESSGSWREVEKIDILEPLAVASMEVEARSPVTADDKGPEDPCAQVLSLEEYWGWFTEKRQVGIATLVQDSARVLTPVVPAIDLDTGRAVMSAQGDTRRVLLTEKMTGPSRSSGLGETKSHREERSGQKKKTRKHKSRKRGASVSGAALQAVLSSPRVRLVDCLTIDDSQILCN